MTSKEIIIKLIDTKKITGEEAYTLLKDILKGEMLAFNEALKNIPSINIPYTSPETTPYTTPWTTYSSTFDNACQNISE